MTWYLLFEQDPQSCLELYVNEKYVGRTTDKEVARKHYQKCCDAQPFGAGGVQIITDTEICWANSITNWDEL